MTEPNSVEPLGLRAHLLGVEPTNVERLERLQKEMQMLYVEELTRKHRVSRTVALVAALAGAAFGAYVTWKINVPAKILSPGLLRAIWALFTLGCVGSAIYSAYVLWQGKIDARQRLTRSRVRLGVVLTMAVFVILQAIGHPNGPTIGWALFALLFVILAVGRCLTEWVRVSELNTREALLRAQLRAGEGQGR